MAQRSWSKNEPLQMTDLPSPTPRRQEVRVSVRAIGVNPVDWKMRSFGPLRVAARLIGPKPPVVVGIDFAGVVEAVGENVREFRVGDRVAGGTNFARGQRGSYADTVVVREDQLCHVPQNVSLEVAGVLSVAGVTAHQALFEHGHLRQVPIERRRVLVLGASGGVGLVATQLAKADGAFVAGVCSGRNAALVESHGVDAVLDYTASDALTQAEAYGPYSVIVDGVGSYSGSRCRALLQSGGRHIMVAGDSPSAALQMFAPPFSSRLLLGSPNGARLAEVLAAVSNGRLDVPIAHRLPLADAEKAHELSRSGHVAGKILLQP